LIAVEAHYKVKPIIYTGERYYDDFLKKNLVIIFFGLPIIILSGKYMQEEWLFWQFTEKSVSGIKAM
jgi:lysozyme